MQRKQNKTKKGNTIKILRDTVLKSDTVLTNKRAEKVEKRE